MNNWTTKDIPSQSGKLALITGATGTGKTVTLQGLAEGFSRAGVPVFLADVKGDLAGIAALFRRLQMGHAERMKSLGLA